ncbi:MAG: SDR family oxidoreductase [candidate division Zixibacteria bacterium]|nr:SDR family oxidoreductase [candidate division Zixibacteria bacterium]
MFYLVTGGAGFIGSNLVERLALSGAKLRILDNFSSGRRENIKHLLDKIELVEGDIRDYWTVVKAVEGVDFILHQAALTSVQRSIKNPLTTNEVNINGTLNILEAAKIHKIKRLVYASSSSVYGDTPTLPKVETMIPNPISPYAISKLAGEEYCQVYYRIYGLQTVCLRYFNVFGPKQNPLSEYAGVIPRFILALLNSQQPCIYGDGEQSRDFTYVENVVEANLKACLKDSIAGEIINVACNQRYTLNQLWDSLTRITAKELAPSYSEPKAGDIRHSLGDISKAKKLLDYEVKIDFEEGLKKTISYYKDLNSL